MIAPEDHLQQAMAVLGYPAEDEGPGIRARSFESEQMMSSVTIPKDYTVNATTSLSGHLDLDLDNIHIREIAPISISSDSKITSDNKVDLGLDNIRVKEFPRIAINPTRVHFPVNLRFGLCTFGVELLAFSVCGESMMVIEDYLPHETEECK